MSGSDFFKVLQEMPLDEENGDSEFQSEESQRKLSLQIVLDAWDDALGEGVDPDIVASTAIFAALSDMIATYGEEAVVKMTDGFGERIRQGEFTLSRTHH